MADWVVIKIELCLLSVAVIGLPEHWPKIDIYFIVFFVFVVDENFSKQKIAYLDLIGVFATFSRIFFLSQKSILTHIFISTSFKIVFL